MNGVKRLAARRASITPCIRINWIKARPAKRADLVSKSKAALDLVAEEVGFVSVDNMITKESCGAT